MMREDVGPAVGTPPASTGGVGDGGLGARPPLWFALVFFGAAELAAIPLLRDVSSCGAAEIDGIGADCVFYSGPATYPLGPFVDVVTIATYGLAVVVVGLAATWLSYRRAGARIQFGWPVLVAVAGLTLTVLLAIQDASSPFGGEIDYGALWIPVAAMVIVSLALQARDGRLVVVAMVNLVAAFGPAVHAYGFRSAADSARAVLPSALLLLISGLVLLASRMRPAHPAAG